MAPKLDPGICKCNKVLRSMFLDCKSACPRVASQMCDISSHRRLKNLTPLRWKMTAVRKETQLLS